MSSKSKAMAVISLAVLLVVVPVGAVADTAADTGITQDAAIRATEGWAFIRNPPPNPNAPKPHLHQPLHVPGSPRTYTLADFSMFSPLDWFPRDHPPMPQIVAHGRKPAFACAVCHMPNGEGVPETASLAGLPEAYLIEQLRAFRRGGRDFPEKMVAEARNLNAADMTLAATYFSSLNFKPWLRVIETQTVPRTHVEDFVLMPDASGAREPLGERIVEVPANIAHYELHDERGGFVAYVPPGSIARGAVIATKGEGTALACEACHGTDLRGIGDIPQLAGRSPTYIVRELILFQAGERTNPSAAPMRQEASRLTLKDMIDVAAYSASRKP